MRANPLGWSFRGQFLAGFVACAGLLAYALYAQFSMLLMPCPLCILQRIAFAALGLVFLIGGLHAPRGRLGRAVDEVPLCTSMGLDYMIEAMGMFEALANVLRGSGECARVDWTFLGLSMPAWTLAWYVGLGLFALWAGFRRR
jgi:disulfide bond formation protein DsbB